MSGMNRILVGEESFRGVVWKKIGLPEGLAIPTLSSDTILYGQLSDGVHGSPGKFVYLTSDAAEEEVIFYTELTNAFKKRPS